MGVDWSRDGESVTCPTCHESWSDLWDYDWGTREEIRTECPHCGMDIVLHRDVHVRYGVSPDVRKVAAK